MGTLKRNTGGALVWCSLVFFRLLHIMKTATTIDEQIERLRSRGMFLKDLDRFARFLPRRGTPHQQISISES